MEGDFNILLLGETGVGKSTFINAFVNYIKFDSLDDARSEDLEIMIPAKFLVMDEDYELKEIKTEDDDSNEKTENVGMSVTQGCKDYVLHTQERTIRLIDTPGIGDTRGIDQDKENIENILNHIGQHGHLNGICILLKPNNARLTVTFRFCIQELLSHLHKSAKDNVVFCFTNARSTFYHPGDTLPSLKEQLKILKEKSNVEILTNKSTLYCFDNEPFRFLLASKKGIKFSDDDEQSFTESWRRSVNETKRLLSYINSCEPHKVKDTLSLNNARRIVNQLSQPLADIDKEIDQQITEINKKKKAILKGDLESSLYKIEYHTEQFDYPRIICFCNKVSYCYEYAMSGDNIINKVISWGGFSLRSLANIGRCNKCECNIKEHATKSYERKSVRIKDEKVEKMIEKFEAKSTDLNDEKQTINMMMEKLEAKSTNLNDKKQNINIMIEKLEARSTGLNNEKQIISDIHFKFVQFLIQSSIAPFNDARIDYLDYLIKDAKNKKDDENYNNETVRP